MKKGFISKSHYKIKVILNRGLYRLAAPRKVFIRGLIHIQTLQRLPLLLSNNLRGRFQIKFGMTLSNSFGFTLIELLVVVLIIGILAAVALPQYQRAVGQARLNNLKKYTRVLETACKVYKMENDTFPTSPNALQIALPIKTYHVPNSTTWYIYLNGGESCTVWVNEEKISCTTTISQKDIAHYRFKDGSQGCVAFSTNKRDFVNQICRNDTQKKGNCASGSSCSYNY